MAWSTPPRSEGGVVSSCLAADLVRFVWDRCVCESSGIGGGRGACACGRTIGLSPHEHGAAELKERKARKKGTKMNNSPTTNLAHRIGTFCFCSFVRCITFVSSGVSRLRPISPSVGPLHRHTYIYPTVGAAAGVGVAGRPPPLSLLPPRSLASPGLGFGRSRGPCGGRGRRSRAAFRAARRRWLA